MLDTAVHPGLNVFFVEKFLTSSWLFFFLILCFESMKLVKATNPDTVQALWGRKKKKSILGFLKCLVFVYFHPYFIVLFFLKKYTSPSPLISASSSSGLKREHTLFLSRSSPSPSHKESWVGAAYLSQVCWVTSRAAGRAWGQAGVVAQGCLQSASPLPAPGEAMQELAGTCQVTS